MTEEAVPVPALSASSVSAISLGMICSVLCVPMLIYSGDYIFVWLPRSLDVWASVKVHIPLLTLFLSDYGVILWTLVAVGTVFSFLEAYRRPGHRRTVAIQVAAFVSALILAWMARNAVWLPLVSLFQGIGTAK